MLSSSVAEPLAVIAAGLDTLARTDWEALRASERLRALGELETVIRRAVAVSHSAAGTLAHEDAATLGDRPPKILADALRITPAEAKRRLRNAGLLADGRAMTGQRLAPQLPATADQWRAGVLDGEHLKVIADFFHQLPTDIPAAEREAAEAFLADKAGALRPDQLSKVADRLAITINPDGVFSDIDRARKRGFTWAPQGPDGMSRATLWASPELRGSLDAYLARFAAPGMCNPEDQTACTAVPDGEQTAPGAATDARTPAQRRHDALCALVRSQLGSPKLGQHNGLPVTIIVSTTLAELQSGAGQAVTAGGTLLPIPDLIRMAASHSYHYLSVFDGATGRALWLGRSKRIASADQRIVLHSKERGCTHPGCDARGYDCEVHHVDEWAAGGRTDIDGLTFACHSHHPLLGPGGWTTRKLKDGTTEWIPPPQLEIPGGTNDFHHPERYLDDGDR